MVSEYDIRRVLACYDLGELADIAQATHGFVNETAFITTCRGRFVIRRNHRRFGTAPLLARHALLTRVAAEGLPAPPPIPARSGETLITLDGRHYEVQQYVAGEDYDPGRPQQSAAVGALLARYHRAAACLTPPLCTQPRYAPRRLADLVEQLTEWDVMGDLHEALTWYSQRAAQLVRQLPEGIYQALPHTIIHGDIHIDNLRFAADDVVALLDFDQFAWDARLADLADALVAFATIPAPGWSPWGVYGGALDLDLAGRLLAGYNAVAPLTPAERGALPIMIETLWLAGELGRVRSTPEGAPDYHQEVLGQGRQLSAWLCANATQLDACMSADQGAVQ